MVTEKGHYSRQSNNPYWIGKANRVLFFLRSYHLFYLKTKFRTTLLKKQFHHCYQSLKTYHLLWGFSYIYNSMGYIFLSVLCSLLLFFFNLFVRPSQKAILHCCISASWDGFAHCLLYKVTNLHP